jgi:hypothetical protein
MLTFKHYLKEYLTPKQSEKWSGVEMDKDAREHTDGLFGPGNDKIVEPLLNYDHNNHNKSEPHRKIEQHLGMQISPEHYKKGRIPDPKYPKRELKIGGLIKEPKLRDEFANDSTRAGSKTSGYYASIVRGYHVAGQTNSVPDEHHPKGHSWGEQSCKNVETGSNREYLKAEIKRGTVVVRIHHPETHEEIYRATLHPHYDEHGNRVYAVNSEYGIKHPSFTAHAHDVARRLSGEYKPGGFDINTEVYNDKGYGNTHVLHPAATPEDIDRELSHWDLDVRRAAARHPSAIGRHITKALQDKDVKVKTAALEGPNVTPDHINTALKGNSDRDSLVRITAITRPAVDSNNIFTALKHKDPVIKEMALDHPKVTPDHIDKALDDSLYYIKQKAITHPKASSDNLFKGLKDKEPTIKKLVLRHPSLTPDHIHVALDDPDPSIGYEAVSHPKASSDNLFKGLKHSNKDVKLEALYHPSSTSDHIHAALDDPDPSIRYAALTHPEAKLEHFKKASSDENERVRNTAIKYAKLAER